MKHMYSTVRICLILIALSAVLPVIQAQKSPSDFSSEPDKTLAAAHESFVKKDFPKAAEQLQKAAADVKAQSVKVAAGSKESMKKAGDELDKLGEGVKNGTVKSAAEMEKTFAKAGASLAGAAQWSGHKLKAGAQASVDGIKKAGEATGKGVKVAAEQVNGWFEGLGEGISDLGSKL